MFCGTLVASPARLAVFVPVLPASAVLAVALVGFVEAEGAFALQQVQAVVAVEDSETRHCRSRQNLRIGVFHLGNLIFLNPHFQPSPRDKNQRVSTKRKKIAFNRFLIIQLYLGIKRLILNLLDFWLKERYDK